MEKPRKPKEPKYEDYPRPKEPNAKNYLGDPLYQKLDWVKDMEEYRLKMEKYKKDMEVYEQVRSIRLIKNATEKYILKNYKITRIK